MTKVHLCTINSCDRITSNQLQFNQLIGLISAKGHSVPQYITYNKNGFKKQAECFDPSGILKVVMEKSIISGGGHFNR